MLRRLARAIGGGRVVALGLLGLCVALRLWDPAPVETLRVKTFDLFQQISPRPYQPLSVAILDIDDPSLEEIGQWPWPRSLMGELVTKATAQGAVAIGFDMVFSERDRLSPEALLALFADLDPGKRAQIAALPDTDTAFAEAVARSRVILGQTSLRSSVFDRADRAPAPGVPHALLGDDPRPYLQRFPDLLQNLPALEAAAAGRGVFTVRPDVDGVFRRIPVTMLVQDNLRLGLAPEVLRVATGGQAFAIRTNAAGIEGVVLAGKLVATDADGSVWPHFTPSVRDRFVSAADLLNDRVPPGRLAGHLVLVGTSAIGLEDFRSMPLGTRIPGVEIHAQLLENILTDSLLHRPNYAIAAEVTAMAVLGLLAILVVPLASASVTVLASLGALVGLGYGGWHLFEARKLLLDPSAPLLTMAVLVVSLITANYLREERRRREIRGAFAQYVSPDLVAQLSENRDALRLGGETRELTLLFSDVRGFTAISERFKSDPQGLTRLMNRFLTVLSGAILAEKGTIDKFMGDAVMAFWNAPVPAPRHQHDACRAALAMRAATEALNATLDPDTPRIDVGVGLNTGLCVVGNMGSDLRFDYTALGDAVNLASRLEGQSKPYGVGIVLGETTAQAVAEDFALLELDLIRVKGKAEAERIYALMGDATLRASAPFRAASADNEAMLAAYRARDWTGAEAARTALARSGADIDLSVYLDLWKDRIAEAAAAPPPPGWDGVHVATSK